MAFIGASLPPAFIPFAVPVAAPVVAPVVAGVAAAALLPEIGGALAVVGLGVALGAAAKFLWGLLANNPPLGLLSSGSSFENISNTPVFYRASGVVHIATSAIWYSGSVPGYYSSGATLISPTYDQYQTCYGMRVTLSSSASQCLPTAGTHELIYNKLVLIETRDINGNWSEYYQYPGANGTYHALHYSWTRTEDATGTITKTGVALLPKTVPLHRPPSFVPLLEPIKQPAKKQEPIPLISPVLPEAEPVTQPAQPETQPLKKPVQPIKETLIKIAPPVIAGALLVTRTGQLSAPAPALVPVTDPGTTFLGPTSIPLTTSGPAPNLEAMAKEMGKQEDKLERIFNAQNAKPSTDVLNNLLELAVRPLYDYIKTFFDDQPGGEYTFQAPCEINPVTGLPNSFASSWPAQPDQFSALVARLDALAALLQIHKDVKQPVCKQAPAVGQPVTVNFVQVD